MARVSCYLVAIMDWPSRKILSWRPSNTQEVGFCPEALDLAFDRFGAPEIVNTAKDNSLHLILLSKL